MPSVRILPPRRTSWGQTVLWALQVVVWLIQAAQRWGDGGAWAAVSVAFLLLSVVMLILALTGRMTRMLTVRADAEGLHRSRLNGRRFTPWGEVARIRPAPARPLRRHQETTTRLEIRAHDGRTLAAGRLLTEPEVAQLHTWHHQASHPG
ncbi:PH domain-containing protein [Serinicoccus profundi]|uniref:PH domain-containing protein n=1 Tax=Serinicoccus profundi TaxID=1078471 RepID=UPI000255E7B2|nr:PH domain-containing protein [Serinicoccus profundi]